MMLRLKTVILVMGMVAAALCPALAAEWYVDNQAGGLNNGTSWADAWRSFADIDWSSVAPGDTVYLSGGSTNKTYTEDLNVFTSGESGSPITITVGQETGHNGTVVISGAGVYLDGNSHLVVTGEYQGERRLKIQDSPGYAFYAGNSPSSGVRFAYAEVTGCQAGYNVFFKGTPTDIEVDHLYVHDPADSDALLLIFWEGNTSGYGAAARIHHNVFDLNGTGQDCIRLAPGGYDVYNNEIYARGTRASHNDGIQVYTSAPISHIRIFDNYIAETGNWSIGISAAQPFSDILIYNNVIDLTHSVSDTKKGIFIRPGAGLSSDNIHVYNNTIVHANYLGIEFDITSDGTTSSMSNVKVTNNLLYASNSIIFNDGFGTIPGIEVDYNCLWATNDSWQEIYYNGATYRPPYAGLNENGTSSQPWLVNPENLDYHLAEEDTACRDRGTDLSAYFTADKDGVIRPRGTAWDIGAYEGAGVSQAEAPVAPSGLHVVY
ncbi:MAG: choice-of-anchor Q domain-containing protein [Spirochaetota bacterium]